MAPTILAALNAPTSIGEEASAVGDTEADEMEEHPPRSRVPRVGKLFQERSDIDLGIAALRG
jgi:hypothetical protein